MITSAVPAFSQSVIGPENLYHHLNQSYQKLKPILIWSDMFSCI